MKNLYPFNMQSKYTTIFNTGNRKPVYSVQLIPQSCFVPPVISMCSSVQLCPFCTYLRNIQWRKTQAVYTDKRFIFSKQLFFFLLNCQHDYMALLYPNQFWKSLCKRQACTTAKDVTTDLLLVAAHRRSSWNCNIWYVKPIPSSPMRYLLGTLTSSKNICAVSDDLVPILSIFLATWTPKNKCSSRKLPETISSLNWKCVFFKIIVMDSFLCLA